MSRAARQKEAASILELVSNDRLRAFEIVERQLSALVLRTQVMLSLCGIVVTVTGFSGRAIAATSELARLSISGGILVVFAAAAVAISGVLRLRWLTQEMTGDAMSMMVAGLEVRDRKSAHLGAALVLFVLGFALYCFAVAQLLIATKIEG